MAEKSVKRFDTRRLAVSALLVAFVVVCAQLALPLPIGLPLSLQTVAVMMIGFLLPPVAAVVVMLVYLLLGVMGLPVFAALQGGLGVLWGPSGGFLWAFVPAVFLISFVYRLRSGRFFACWAAVFGLVLIYICGVGQFAFVTGIGVAKSLLAVAIPCVPGEVLKLVLAVIFAEAFAHRGFVF